MKLSSAELSALMSTSGFEDQRDAVRNAQYKISAALTKSRERTGFSDADIMEGLAMGCDKTDVSFYTYTALEYIMRYTSKYGAAVVIIAGIFQVLQTATAVGSKLFSMIFPSKNDASKAMYKKDAAAIADWMTSGTSPAELIGSLLSTFELILPPSLRMAVKAAGVGASAVKNVTETAGSITPYTPSSGPITLPPGYNPGLGGIIGGAVAGPTGAAAGSLLEQILKLAQQDAVVRDATVRDSGANNLRVARRRI